MPSYEDCGCKFMLDVLAGDKNLLEMSKVTELNVPRYTEFNVPRYSEFSLESLINEVSEDEEVMQYMPYCQEQEPQP